MNSFLEPVIYGKTTGVSALGLLVAAMFWTWLQDGAQPDPLNADDHVCLAVLGKSVPGLRVFSILLSEEEPLETDVRVYQRLLAVDADGAFAIVDEALSKQARAEVFEDVPDPGPISGLSATTTARTSTIPNARSSGGSSPT